MTSTEKAIIIAKITALLEAELTVTDEQPFVHVKEGRIKMVPFVSGEEEQSRKLSTIEGLAGPEKTLYPRNKHKCVIRKRKKNNVFTPEDDTQTRNCIGIKNDDTACIVNPFTFSNKPFEIYNPFSKDRVDEDHAICLVASDESKQQ